tara:strand:+ start:1263 stop:1769 length:507 start_codon:yes stop_codon:yes gene_type:complete
LVINVAVNSNQIRNIEKIGVSRMIDEDLEVGEEIHEVSDNSPTLTGDVASHQDQPEISQNPPELQKRLMNKNLQFFLGVLAYPILLIIASYLFFEIGWAIGNYDTGVFIQWTVIVGGYVVGIVLGFTSGHRSFAWGIIASIVIIPFLIFILFLLLILLFVFSDPIPGM